MEGGKAARPAVGPVFIVGAPRSGTTLLYKLLCLHPETAWISNWVRRFPALPQLSALNALARLVPAATERCWFAEDSNAYVYGHRRSLPARVFPAPAEGEPVFQRAGLRESEIRSADDVVPETAERLRKSLAAIQRYCGGGLFVSKRVANNRRIRLLVDAFPSAAFIEIVRDGRAVAYSLSSVDWWPQSRIWWNGSTPLEWEAAGGDPWELRARSWVEELEATARGLAGVPAARVMRIAYEEFVAHPRDSLAEIQKFVGLYDSASWNRAVAGFRVRPSEARWRTHLPGDAIARIEAVQKGLLELHGYTLISGDQPRGGRKLRAEPGPV